MRARTTKKILVTGGFGFIGSHLVELLLTDGEEARVHIVDNLSTSPIDVNAYKCVGNGKERLTYDICSVEEFFARPDVDRFDEIYHLAAVVGPVGVLAHSGEILRRTTLDTYAIADYAVRSGTKVCDISTSEVYGGGRDGYCCERDSMIITPKISPRLEYAVAKLACEVALGNMVREQRLVATIVRPFNVAGPRQVTGGGFVLPRFIHQALADEPLTVYGDGSMVRAFTHVRDIADGIIRALRMGQPGAIYNVGNPANKTTILDLAGRVLDVVGSRSQITFVDPKTLWGESFEEANDKYPDADRAINELEWQPKYSIDEIIRQATDYIAGRRRD